MTKTDLHRRAEQFRALHETGTFLMPNAWNAGSARLLAAEGFPAIATTSAGIAFALGRADYENALSRDENIDVIAQIAAATAIPDAEITSFFKQT